MAKRKTGKNAEQAGLELLSNGLLVRKSNMEVVGIYGGTDKSNLKHLVIPEGVKSIKVNVFSRHGEIISVSFPESLEKIGALSFSMCHALRKSASLKMSKSLSILRSMAATIWRK